MSEWRTIPEFPLYQITSDGDVRHRYSRYVLKEILNKVTGAYFYSLHKDGEKKRYSRSFWGLVYSAWPELLSEWKPLPNYPGYLFNKEGKVMATRWYNVIPEVRPGVVRLVKDGKRPYVDIHYFDYSVFDEEQEAA